MPRLTAQKFLVVYSGVLTLVFAFTFLSGFMQAGIAPQSFDTISVQRINIVEPDGTIRMVISNNNRIPGIIVHGHEYADYGGRKAQTTAGMLFYDADATESGGLTFGGHKAADGSISRFGHLSFDRYNQDQMFSIDAADDGRNNASTVRMLDQPTWSIEEYLQLLDRIQNLPPDQQEAAKQKFFESHPPGIGTRTLLSNETYPDAPTQSQNGLDLRDSTGHDRTHLRIDSNANPTLQFLDQNGSVTNTYPPQVTTGPGPGSK